MCAKLKCCPLQNHPARRAELIKMERVGVRVPVDWGGGHLIGVVRVLDRVCDKAKFEDVTPHVLRHTFTSIAAELGFMELTIAGLLGHASRGETQRYIHLDSALVLAVDQVVAEIARLIMPDLSRFQRIAAQ
jgi:integrase